MMLQVVLYMAILVEPWELRMRTAATAIASLVKTPPTGLIILVTDVTGMKRMMLQVVLLMAILVEPWELQMRTAATV
jgi:hypothetical protein